MENWRTVPGFEAYRISDHGRVRSCWAKWGRGGSEAGAVIGDDWVEMTLNRNAQGYLRVNLFAAPGKPKTKLIHRLVALAFLGDPPMGRPLARHLDGNQLHNHVSNLAWGSGKENTDDMLRHGTWRLRYKGARLTPPQRDEIRRRAAAGEPYTRIAPDFGVNPQSVANVVQGKTWKMSPETIASELV